MEPDEVVGAQFRMHRSTPGYVRIDYVDGAELTGQDAREVLQALASLANGRPTPVLVDVRMAHSVSREARTAFAGTAIASRVAVYVASSLSRVIANFFIGVSDPSVPTKLFTDLDDAQRWLVDDDDGSHDGTR